MSTNSNESAQARSSRLLHERAEAILAQALPPQGRDPHNYTASEYMIAAGQAEVELESGHIDKPPADPQEAILVGVLGEVGYAAEASPQAELIARAHELLDEQGLGEDHT